MMDTKNHSKWQGYLYWLSIGHTVDDEGDPRGDVHTYRMALWSAHFGGFDEAFLNPNTDECREKGKYDFNLFTTIILIYVTDSSSLHKSIFM